MFFALAFIILVFIFVAIFGLISFSKIVSSSQEIIKKDIPLNRAVKQALLSMLDGELALEDVLAIDDPLQTEKLQEKDILFKKSILDFGVYIAAITWGTETEEFAKSGGGLNTLEWERLGLKGKLVILPPSQEQVQLAGVTNLYFSGFTNNGLRALGSHRDSLLLRQAGQLTQAEAKEREAENYKIAFLNYAGKAAKTMDEIVEKANANIEESGRVIEETQNDAQRTLSLAFFLALVVAVATILIFTRFFILQPVDTLIKTVQKFGAGDLAARANIRTRDELEFLGNSFNKMAENLTAYAANLERAKSKDDAILESIGDGIIVVDSKAKIIRMNSVAERMLSLNQEEVTGKRLFDVFPIEDDKGKLVREEDHPMNIAFAAGIISGTFYYVRRDKTKFPVAVTVAPVVLEGETIGAIEVFRDITREKEIDKAKTEFVSLASHQLRTPLSTVSWYAEMLLAGDAGKLNETQKKYLEEVYGSNRRMVELVNALLNVSRLELGTFMIEPEPTDIVRLVRSAIDEQKPQIDEKRIKLSLVFEENIPLMQVDPKLLRMVFQNLLSNAVKYTPEAGKIEFSISLNNKENVLIKVSDTGYGIPKKQQDQIFTKLFRADNVREKSTEGTGLGLYIVKSIVEHSGGKIWFESEENKGTTFYAMLPLEGMKKKEGTKALS